MLPDATKMFYAPRAAADVAWVRLVLVSAFLWKLLSRDFSMFAAAPAAVLDMYPCNQFPLPLGDGWLGFGPVLDLATWHWIHWFLPMPGVSGFHIVQGLTGGFCVAVLLFGRGPRNLFAIGLYCLMSYLWGYVWRTGALLDTLFPALQTLLVYCFFREPEAWILFRRCRALNFSAGNGAFISTFYSIIIFYYWSSGINKLVDISPQEWFNYDLITGVEYLLEMIECGAYQSLGPVAPYLRGQYWMAFVGVPLVYAVELSIPAMYFRRSFISAYACFFFSFHLIAWSLQACFFGLFFVWIAVIPVSRLLEPLQLEGGRAVRMITLLRWGNWFGLLHFTCSQTSEPGWPSLLVAKSLVSGTQWHDLWAVRRAMWVCPPMWPILAISYLPLVMPLTSLLARWRVRGKAMVTAS